MKNFSLLLAIFFSVMVLVSCKKESPDQVVVAPTTPINQNAGLGQATGYPSGKIFKLPKGVNIIGEIRGGLSGKAPIDKTYKGPFNNEPKSTYVTLGTGTYVNLYITFYNSNSAPANFTLPGGLIFLDSNDVYQHVPVYQKGYILQNVNVGIGGQDTAFIQLRAYCLNHTLSPSTYDAVYYFGPVTSNLQLNQVTGIMSTKQYPFGAEFDIQTIIWNITDYGQVLTATEIAYLNSLP